MCKEWLWASHSSQTRLLSQSTSILLSCSWIWDTKGLIKQLLTWGNWESQRALPVEACCLELPGSETEGPDQEKWAVGNEHGSKESTVRQEQENTWQSASGREGWDRFSKAKKRTAEIKKEEKVKGNVCRNPNEMTIIHVLSKAWWNTKQMLWAVNLPRKWSYKYIIQGAQVMSISWAWQTHVNCCKFQFTLRCWSVNL